MSSQREFVKKKNPSHGKRPRACKNAEDIIGTFVESSFGNDGVKFANEQNKLCCAMGPMKESNIQLAKRQQIQPVTSLYNWKKKEKHWTLINPDRILRISEDSTPGK